MIHDHARYGLDEVQKAGLELPADLATALNHLERVQEAAHVLPDLRPFQEVAANPKSTDKELAAAFAGYRAAESAANVSVQGLVGAAERAVEAAYWPSRAGLTDQALKRTKPALATLAELLPTFDVNAIRGVAQDMTRSQQRARLTAMDAIDVIAAAWTTAWDLGVLPRLRDIKGVEGEVTATAAGLALFTDVDESYGDYMNAPGIDGLKLADFAVLVNGGMRLQLNTLDEARALVDGWSKDRINWTKTSPGAPIRRKNAAELAMEAAQAAAASKGISGARIARAMNAAALREL